MPAKLPIVQIVCSKDFSPYDLKDLRKDWSPYYKPIRTLVFMISKI